MTMRRRIALLASLMLPLATAAGQPLDLPRLVVQYRTGNVAAAIEGLQQLQRLATTSDQRALAEHHLGMAQLRLGSTEATATLRRSIAWNPDLRPDSGASADERAAWSAVRDDMAVPTDVVVDPGSMVVAAHESVGITVTTTRPGQRQSARVRLRIVRNGVRDTVTLWSGRSGVRTSWDGLASGVPLTDGRYALLVEVDDERIPMPIRWRRVIEIGSQPVAQPLELPAKPATDVRFTTVAVPDASRKNAGILRSLAWAATGLAVAGIANALVTPVVERSAANSAMRYAVAGAYGMGVGAAVVGFTTAARRAVRQPVEEVPVPDEAAIRQHRSALSAWVADSARISTLNLRRGDLSRMTIRILGPE